MGVISKIIYSNSISLSDAFFILQKHDPDATEIEICFVLQRIGTEKTYTNDYDKEKFRYKFTSGDNNQRISKAVSQIKALISNNGLDLNFIISEIEELRNELFSIGWDRDYFYDELNRIGINIKNPKQSSHEPYTIYSGCDFANLGDVVDDILRLNPTIPYPKEKLAKVLAEGTNFSWSHDITDGDISLAHVKKKCDHLGLVFPWKPLTEAAETTQEVLNTPMQGNTHQEEIKRLQNRIAELEAELEMLRQQQNKQATAQATESQGDNAPTNKKDDLITTLQKENEQLKDELKESRKAKPMPEDYPDFLEITEPIKMIAETQKVFFNPETFSGVRSKEFNNTKEDIYKWIKNNSSITNDVVVKAIYCCARTEKFMSNQPNKNKKTTKGG